MPEIAPGVILELGCLVREARQALLDASSSRSFFYRDEKVMLADRHLAQVERLVQQLLQEAA